MAGVFVMAMVATLVVNVVDLLQLMKASERAGGDDEGGGEGPLVLALAPRQPRAWGLLPPA